MSSCCCQSKEPPKEPSSCCSSPQNRVDWLFWISLAIIGAAYLAHLFFHQALGGMQHLGPFTHGVFELMNKMWWGILAGILAVGVIGSVPREFVTAVLGPGGRLSGVLRACGAGLLLDLCNHGILLVGMKLYERGASLGQVFAFLVASPWNSLSLTLILVSLIGLKWTLIIIALSAVIAVITGLLADFLVAHGLLPPNPHQRDLPPGFRFWPEARQRFSATRIDLRFAAGTLKRAFSESRMILRWIFLGTILAAGIRTVFDPATFAQWFGPTIGGFFLTVAAATIIEVCSEGSSPVAADLMTRARAPGNSFAFLMAGASTDYTEILALRETTKSWKLSLALPLLTTPQILLIAWILNSSPI